MNTEALLSQLQKLQSDRGDVEGEWRDIGTHMHPIRQELSIGRRTKRGQIMDSTAIYASNNLAGGIYGAMTNPANRWFELGAMDQDKGVSKAGRAWFEYATTKVLRTFGPSYSAFYAQVAETFKDLSVFGGGPFYSSHVSGTSKFHDIAINLWQIYPIFDDFGELIGCYRVYPASVLGLRDRFGAGVPEKVLALAEKNPAIRVETVHVVRRNSDFREGMLGVKGKPLVSAYILNEGVKGHVLGVSGHYAMPYMYPLWSCPPGDSYGQGPGFDALTDAKVLNAAERSNLQIMRRNAEPPMLAPDKGVIQTLRTSPGGVTYGGVTRRGEVLVRPLDNGGRVQLQLEISEQKRLAIKDAFYWSVMQLVGRTGMSATEVLERSEEKGRLMGPHIGRVQTGLLAPLVISRFQALVRNGQLPDPPPDIQDIEISVEYTSPLAKAQKSLEATATVRLLTTIGEMSKLYPEMADKIDPDAAVDVLQDGFGAPSRVLRDTQIVAQVRGERAQGEQAAQMMQMAQRGASAIADIGAAVRPGAGQMPAQADQPALEDMVAP